MTREEYRLEEYDDEIATDYEESDGDYGYNDPRTYGVVKGIDY